MLKGLLDSCHSGCDIGDNAGFDISYGCIEGWYILGIISEKFRNELLDNFATALRHDKKWENTMLKKYKRVLSS